MSNNRSSLDTRLKEWGNSFGIVVPKAMARSLGLEPGMPIHVTIEHEAARNDATQLPVWAFPHRDTREVLDEADGPDSE